MHPLFAHLLKALYYYYPYAPLGAFLWDLPMLHPKGQRYLKH
jgi:hypothetical protein